MPLSPADLPTNVAELHALIVANEAALAAKDAELTAAKEGLKVKVLELEKLKIELARLKRMKFGRSSERLEREIKQMELLIEDLEAETAGDQGVDDAAPGETAPKAADDAETDKPRDAKPAKPASRGTRRFPEHLPRKPVVHDPGETCGECGGELRKVGETETEVLTYIPGRFEVIQNIRPAKSCRCCETMVQAPMPSLPIVRGMPSPELLAQIIVSKFCDHLPLYRQEQIYARAGVTLTRTLMAGWMGKIAELIDALVEAAGKHVMAGDHIHVDDTPAPTLDPGRGRTKTGHQWIYLRDERPHAGQAAPAALYRYTPDRKAEHPRTELAGFKGAMHADGYTGFNQLYQANGSAPPAIVEVACWSHARRKIHDVHATQETALTRKGLDLIAQLFAIERGISGCPPDQRRAVRQRESKPVLDAFWAYIETSLRQLPTKSPMADALRYAKVRWTALTRFVDDGHLEISNNAAERGIKPLVLGRKNWLFAGSEAGGHRAAKFYTLIETAKLNGVDPMAYMTAVLSRTADHPINRIDELLPWRIELPVRDS
ncbi:IS66 family transposase [Rhodovibrio sodomensis]|uniref:IS66 family transposase n=1 Tax=Rhodovibrio sodomensis TaxID=1088 RepID=A0ABS1DLU6_9PROT|nr:IS66 family transposase [Rhodovibrio sodomensis]MBK1671505.1 IS66 family transposase [Rhodovibrio sodomensis]